MKLSSISTTMSATIKQYHHRVINPPTSNGTISNIYSMVKKSNLPTPVLKPIPHNKSFLTSSASSSTPLTAIYTKQSMSNSITMSRLKFQMRREKSRPRNILIYGKFQNTYTFILIGQDTTPDNNKP